MFPSFPHFHAGVSGGFPTAAAKSLFFQIVEIAFYVPAKKKKRTSKQATSKLLVKKTLYK